MIYISHRGNISGVFPEKENTIDYIEDALNTGFECEIDLRMKNGILYLGHDFPQYDIDSKWLEERKNKLWIHAKDYASVIWLSERSNHFRYFCHEQDRFTLTSNGFIWSHDLKNKMTNKCIVPLLSLEQVKNYKQKHFYGICSDFVIECKKKWK